MNRFFYFFLFSLILLSAEAISRNKKAKSPSIDDNLNTVSLMDTLDEASSSEHKKSKSHRGYSSATLRSLMATSLLGYPCTLLLDTNTSIGCSQKDEVVYGTLQYFRTPQDKIKFRETVVVLEPEMMNKTNLKSISKKKGVVGILVLWGTPTSVLPLSHDIKTPNKDSGFVWNPAGDSLSRTHFKIPIWLVHERDTEKIRKNAMDNTNQDSKKKRTHGVSFYTHMSAGTDSVTCLRRDKCLPVGGQSVLGALTPITGTKNVVFATARLDSDSFFHDYVPGNDAYTSGTIALLAAHVALRNFFAINETKNNSTSWTPAEMSLENDILFAYLQGESYDYIGSRKLVDDLMNFECKKVNPEDPMECEKPYMASMLYQNASIKNAVGVIDVGQIAYSFINEDKTLFIHSSKEESTLWNAFSKAYESMETSNIHIKFVANETQGLPPSSVIPFTEARKDIPAAVIADHEHEFVNPAYNAHYDNVKLNGDLLCESATLVARTLLKLGLGSNTEFPDNITSLVADCDLVKDLVVCLTENFHCDLVLDYIGNVSSTTGTKHVHVPKYTGVFGYSDSSFHLNLHSRFVNALLTVKTQEENTNTPCSSTSPCEDDMVCVRYDKDGNKTCIRSEIRYHNAISLGIEYSDSNYLWKVTDKTKHIWTESYWNTLSYTLISQEPDNRIFGILAWGIVEFFVSVGVSYLLWFVVSRFFEFNRVI